MKHFRGYYREKMPLLVRKGLVPATAERIMYLRLGLALPFDEYVHTSTGTAYSGDNKDGFKIIPFSGDLTEISSETPIYNDKIETTQEHYDLLEAEEYARENMILGRDLTEQEALTHLGWLSALNNNKRLLERVVNVVFRKMRNKYNKKEAMAFFLRGVQRCPIISALGIGTIKHGCGAYDFSGLASDSAHLVGESKLGLSFRACLPKMLRELKKFH